jgi:parvulin-like peptidyl-prolyl isomerase
MSITAFALCTVALLKGQGSDTAVTINGEALSSQNYYRRMEYLPGLGRKTNTGQFIEIMPAIATLDTLVTETLILQIAKSKGLTPSETEIDQEVSYRLRNNPNYVKDWQSTGRTLPELRYFVKVERAQFKIQTEGIVVTESDIQRNYDGAKSSRYTVPERVKLRVIILRDEADKAKVDAGLKAGKSFESLATTYSTDPSKTVGGDFGVVPIDLLGEEVKTAIKPLKKGERTAWLGKESVYAKFQLEASMPSSVIPLDAKIKEDLRREMMVIKGTGKIDMNKLIREARQNATITVTSPEIDKAYKQFVDLEKKAKSGG